jgi:hypothetical protein
VQAGVEVRLEASYTPWGFDAPREIHFMDFEGFDGVAGLG